MPHTQIAIDGPAGAGKSTIAKLVASELGFIYIDTGAMYRAITLKALRLNIDLTDESAFHFVYETNFSFEDGTLFMDGENVSRAIREDNVSNNVSLVASYISVRQKLVKMQQKLAENKDVVMDGRDIGYHVLPNAEYKYYLTASIEKRAERRFYDNLARGIKSDMDTIKEEVKRRDHFDSTREHTPLKKADDAKVIDTSHLTIEQVVKLIIQNVREEEVYGF
jgi:cytidylate kinase